VEGARKDLLDGVEHAATDQVRPKSLILLGGYGTGKSHWLESFRHTALDRGFVVSTVSVGKEGLLFDCSKLYRACVESATAQGVTGPALEGIAFTYHSDRAPGFRQFNQWQQKPDDSFRRLELTLRLYTDREMDEELRESIVREWSGYPMKVPDLKKALKGAGMTKEIVRPYDKAGLDRARFAFLNQFFRSAGRKGWIVLLDEGETMARYSTLQRLRSYANLSWLLGSDDHAGPGVLLAMADDWLPQVLNGGRNDQEKLRARYEGRV